ncbi:MAG: tetratricopeptide repeat protein [Myxococcaceae bacterium]
MNADLKNIKLFLQQDHLEAAAKKLSELHDQFSKNSAFMNLQAIYLTKQGRYNEAIGILAILAEKMPNDWAVFYNLAYLLRIKGHFRAAHEAIKKSIRISPLNPVAYFEYAHILTTQKLLNEAIMALFKSIELDNLFFPGYVALSFYLQLDNQKGLAIQLYETAVRDAPNIQFFKDRLGELKGL